MLLICCNKDSKALCTYCCLTVFLTLYAVHKDTFSLPTLHGVLSLISIWAKLPGQQSKLGYTTCCLQAKWGPPRFHWWEGTSTTSPLLSLWNWLLLGHWIKISYTAKNLNILIYNHCSYYYYNLKNSCGPYTYRFLIMWCTTENTWMPLS